jgi:hypothetical protein
MCLMCYEVGTSVSGMHRADFFHTSCVTSCVRFVGFVLRTSITRRRISDLVWCGVCQVCAPIWASCHLLCHKRSWIVLPNLWLHVCREDATPGAGLCFDMQVMEHNSQCKYLQFAVQNDAISSRRRRTGNHIRIFAPFIDLTLEFYYKEEIRTVKKRNCFQNVFSQLVFAPSLK